MYLIAGSIYFDPITGKLSKGDKELYLGHNAKECLMLLITNKGMIISKEEIISQVWNSKGVVVSDNALRQTMYTIRKSLKYLSREHEIITTIPRKGYRIELVRQLTESEAVRFHQAEASRLSVNDKTSYKQWATKAGPALRILTVVAGISAAFNLFYLPFSQENVNQNAASEKIVARETQSAPPFKNNMLEGAPGGLISDEETLVDTVSDKQFQPVNKKS
ncbi:winged helix-turn-helix domain-containing protein [Pantoea sp. SORGH_AS_0659]|uniref:winged helix-turn-helix domain-containing protein n=1 Tax=Pantoea sp. SORGH_AS_0659 TaxID=3062597 RepID=UPI00285E84A2|nr:winged helix-turn-helix domain-containing protein [Pantoea sp. SORGH_AS_0659]MDR6352512.1 DNA-binding winged helix-turn-helix (wHTH) protein [Pantoea sp. SORGH_AS_0659]